MDLCEYILLLPHGMPFRDIRESNNNQHFCCFFWQIWLHRREMPGPFGGQCRPCFARQCPRFEQAAPCTVQPASSNSQLAKRQAALRLTVIEDDGSSRFPSILQVFSVDL